MKKTPHYLLPENRELVCPLCKKQTPVEQTRLEQIKTWMQNHNGWYAEDLVQEARAGKFTDWACLSCESKASVIFPDYSKQNYGIGGPIMIYRDKTLNCETCQKDFTFSASEQKFWYEDLHFNYYAYPKSCACCRKNIREPRILNKKLGELLNSKDEGPETLTAIGDIYTKLGITAKADIFYARAKNKRNENNHKT
ncbi:MAG: zinc-ribbon domain containing protein [Bacteroidota bacterium]